jgi:hypothetical protein
MNLLRSSLSFSRARTLREIQVSNHPKVVAQAKRGGIPTSHQPGQNTNTMEEGNRSVEGLGPARLNDSIASLLMGLIVVRESHGSWAKKQAVFFHP